MKLLISAACFMALFALGSVDVQACSCGIPSAERLEAMSDAELSEMLTASDGAIFIGRVAKRVRAESAIGGSWGVTFEVERYWRGPATRQVLVYTWTQEAACGVRYAPGRRYLVIAAKLKGDLVTNYCSHLTASKHKDLLMRRLGPGERPGPRTKPNNGMHPTRIRLPLVENLSVSGLCAGG